MNKDLFENLDSDFLLKRIKEQLNILSETENTDGLLIKECGVSLEFTFFNEGWHNLMTKKDPDTAPWYPGLSFDDAKQYQLSLIDALNRRTPRKIAYRFKNADNKTFLINETIVPRYDSARNLTGLICIGQDVSEKEELKQSIALALEVMWFVFSRFPGSIFWKDINSVYLGCNKAFLQVAGLESEKEIIGKCDYELPWTKGESDAYIADDKDVISTGIPKLDIIEPQHTIDGEMIWFLTNKRAIFDSQDRIIGIIGTSANITEQRIATQKLQIQLHYSKALNKISETIIKQSDTAILLQAAGEIIGSTLNAERVQIFGVDKFTEKAYKLSKWTLSADRTDWPDAEIFDVSLVRNANEYALKTGNFLTSYMHNVNQILSGDGSGEMLHNIQKIKSLLWYPFYFNSSGYYVLTLSNVNEMIEWTKEDTGFLNSVTDLLTIALQKNNLITERMRVENELKESENNLRTLIEALPDQVYFKDLEGRWLTANDSALKFYGITNADYKGKTDMELASAHPEFSDVFDECAMSDKIAWEKKKTLQYEKTIQFADSGPVILSITKIPIYAENGRPKGLAVIRRDITETKKNETELIILSQAIEQSPVSVIITNTDGSIKYANPKFSKITGYSSAEVIGKNPRLLKAGNKTKQEYAEMWSVISRGEIWKGEFLNKRKDGSLFWESATLSAIKNSEGKITNYLGIKEDITEKKVLEVNLKRVLEKAEESDKFKSSLMANMSHEFRTPMNGILGLASILVEMTDDEEKLEMLNGIIISGMRLMDTLASVLELADLDASVGTKDFKLVNISEIITKIGFDYKQKAEAKELVFNINLSGNNLFVKANTKDMITLFNKLIDNSVKFTLRGQVDLTIDSEKIENADYVKISIRDTGIGISDENLPKIFEEFRQVSEGISRHYEGSGVGLSLVKKIVNSLNGRILVESEVGKGSTFTILLPAYKKPGNESRSAQLSAAELTAPANHSELPLVLLVEDNTVNKEVTEMFLEQLCSIQWASSGSEAVRLASANNYSIILMDINLGAQLDGLETTKLIRELPGYDKIPVVAITGYSMESDKERFLARGIDYVLTKPFSKEDIRALIIRILNDYETA
jgi:PAS domain S-box-containing protein